MDFLTRIDKILRSSVKEIIQIPVDAPNGMLYAPKKYKGLGIMRASWEAYIQSFGICHNLQSINNEFVSASRDLNGEKQKCLDQLGLSYESLCLDPEESQMRSTAITKKMRETMRAKAFEEWSSLPQKGKGICLFDECTMANKWICSREGLSSSQWINAIKMNGNVTAVRAIPGRSMDTTRCRFCDETETLGHVLGFCKRGELLRNNRHHSVRGIISDALRQTGMNVYEEVGCLSLEGSIRRVDIIAFMPNSKHGFVIDPTIRMETERSQPIEVDLEKKTIYEPCSVDLMGKYDLNSIEVIGLFVGARGTISQFFEKFRLRFALPRRLVQDIVLTVLRGSNAILNNHLYHPF